MEAYSFFIKTIHYIREIDYGGLVEEFNIFDNMVNSEECKKIADIIDAIKEIKYGFVDKRTGKVYDDREWIHNCPDLTKYYVVETNGEETLKNKLGICTDQCFAIDYLMKKNHPEISGCLFALTKGKFGHCTYGFCDNGVYYYLENAWNKMKIDDKPTLYGPFKSEEELCAFFNKIYTDHHKNDTEAETRVEKYEEYLKKNLLENFFINTEESFDAKVLYEYEHQYRCPRCGAYLDPGEKCDCTDDEKPKEDFKKQAPVFNVKTPSIKKVPSIRKTPSKEVPGQLKLPLEESRLPKDPSIDPQFGIPSQKKYPLFDEQHVRSAIKLFGHVEPKYEIELARAIIAKMKKYGIPYDEVGKENKLYKYIPASFRNKKG